MRINIVTINLNNRIGLEMTMRSVLSQSFFDKIDYIVIDGGSTDGSKEFIEGYSDKLYYWCSERDNGIFDAMNKGIDHLEGEYVLFLNSGDYLESSNVIERVYGELDADIVYGNEVRVKKVRGKDRVFTTSFPDRLDEDFFRVNALPHQSTFIRVKLHKEHKYDDTCIIAGDWKFTREVIMAYGVSYKHVPFVISVYNLNGISSKKFDVFLKEREDYYSKLNDVKG